MAKNADFITPAILLSDPAVCQSVGVSVNFIKVLDNSIEML